MVNVVMVTISEVGLAASINILNVFVVLVAFAILRIQPLNVRIYFPELYLNGLRNNPLRSGALLQKFVSLNFISHLRFLNMICRLHWRCRSMSLLVMLDWTQLFT